MQIRTELSGAELKEYLLATAKKQEERAGQLRRLAASELESADACAYAAAQMREEAASIDTEEVGFVPPPVVVDMQAKADMLALMRMNKA